MPQSPSISLDQKTSWSRFVFVFGDGDGMAQGVHKCFIDIFMKDGKSSEDEAKTRLYQKLRNFTYVRDIWS